MVNDMMPDATRPETRQTIVAGWPAVQRMLKDGGWAELAERADRMAYDINHRLPHLTREIESAKPKASGIVRPEPTR
jgi:hypothetical protein